MLKLVPIKETGLIINPFKNIGKDGVQRYFIRLVDNTTTSMQENGGGTLKKRSAFTWGTKEYCEAYKANAEAKGLTARGKIIQLDVMEDMLTPGLLKKYVRESHCLFNDQGKPIAIAEEFEDEYLKRPFDNGPVLTSAGKRIFVFFYINEDETHNDIKIQHDNIDDVTAARKNMIALKNSSLTPPADNPVLENEADKLQAFIDTAPTMTVPELKEYAQANGINIGNNTKAPKLIEIITEALTPVTTE